MTDHPYPRSPRRRLIVGLAALLTATVLPYRAAMASEAPPPDEPSQPRAAATGGVWNPDGGGMTGYRMGDLSGGGDRTFTSFAGMSSDGRVAGTTTEFEHERAFTWRRGGGGIEVLNSLTDGTVADAIAPNGTIVGHGVGQPQEQRGIVRWTPRADGSMGEPELIVATPEGSPYVGRPEAVNSRGEVLAGGRVYGSGGVRELPSLYRTGDPRHDSYVNALHSAMNERGEVAGMSNYHPGDGEEWESSVTIWRGSTPQGIGLPPIEGYTTVYGINSKGEVLVRVWVSPEEVHTFLYTGGAFEQIEPPEGYTSVIPESLNERGEVVGLIDNDETYTSFIWRDGHTRDLGAMITSEEWSKLTAHTINDKGQILAEAVSSQSGVRPLLLDPVDPVIFIHGAGASRLSTYSNDDELEPKWLECTVSRQELSLWPEDDPDPSIQAADALRYPFCGVANHHVSSDLDVYGTMLTRLKASGTFHEYNTKARPSARTRLGCDLTQEADSPNLFVFAYDWRKSNVESAEKLEDFIGCVEKFWPGSKINFVTHSMGGLVARRYLLEHPDHDIRRMVTLGAPWLGATKLVNVLQTGDFAGTPANGISLDVIRHIVSGFPAAHQLMASRLYQDSAGPAVFRENGWDINGDGRSQGAYSYDQTARLINLQNPRSRPSDTAAQFQTFETSQGGQSDWRQDDTGVEYIHVVGLQAGQNTIGSVVANKRMVCTLGLFCEPEEFISQDLVCGDQTVPFTSASRVTPAGDFNAPGSDVRVFRASSTSANKSVEHTGMAANIDVDGGLFEALTSMDELQPSDHGAAQHAEPNTAACLYADGEADVPEGSSLAADAPAREVDLDHQLRYVHVLGGTDVTVTDSAGWTTHPDREGVHVLDDVTLYPSDRPEASMVTAPVSRDRSFSVDFTATGSPLQLEVLQGTQADPVEATRWIDADLEEGTKARLSLTALGSEILRTDPDGDGDYDVDVAADVRLNGATASDVDAPEVTVAATEAGAARRFTVAASDAGSGVDRVLWSTDGEHFERYDGPLTIDPATTPMLTVFAEDRAGNRSAPVVTELADVPLTALTTATVTPEPEDSGWNGDDVHVSLDAEATEGGAAVTGISWSLEGATTEAATTAAGSTVGIDLDAEGTTVVRYRSITSSGTQEPEQTLTIRIDAERPTVALRDPAEGSVIGSLDQIAGTAADDASGVADVHLSLRNAAGRWWDGTSWATEPSWLATLGTTTWERTTGLPSGSDLPAGAYRLAVRATDDAGHQTTAPARTVTVSADAGRRVTELAPAVGVSRAASATAINNRGTAVGAIRASSSAGPARWSHGSVEELPLPAGTTDGTVAAVSESGTAVGEAGTGSGAIAVRWAPDGAAQALPALPGALTSWALGVSPDGRLVVGHSDDRPVRWDAGAVHQLPLGPGGLEGRAQAVGRDGSIVGWVRTETRTKAVRWAGGEPVELGSLGGDSYATAVNSFGTAVGSSVDRNGATHAVVFGPDGPTVIDEGLLAASSTANSINDRGEVVGQYTDRKGVKRAFHWSKATATVELGTLVPDAPWTFVDARSINDLGQIAGYGTINGRSSGFVISTVHAPVAEDTTAHAEDGKPVTLELDGWDADPGDALTASIVDGPAHGTLGGLDDLAVTYTPEPGFSGTDRITWKVSDGTFDSVVGTITIAVTTTEVPNEAPTAVITGPAAVDEGGVIALDASASSDAEGPIAAYRWDLDGDGAFDDASGPTASVPSTDDGAIAASVEVTDDGGATASARHDVTVRNVAPAVVKPADGSITAGDTYTGTGSWTDPGNDTATATVDFGDGTGVAPLALDDRTFALSHRYDTAGTFPVTVRLCDDDGGCATTSHQVKVAAKPTPPPGTPVPGPGMVGVAGGFTWPGTKDKAVITVLATVGKTRPVGVVAVERSGSKAAALAGVTLESGGVWTEGTTRVARLTGSGVMATKAGRTSVRIEVVVLDGPKEDRIFLKVTKANGTVVPELSFTGDRTTGSVRLTAGVATVVDQ